MRMVAPRTGVPEVTVAENQPEYFPITVGVWHDSENGQSGVLIRCKPSVEDLAKLNAGEDLFISLMTFGEPMQPISVQVGPEGWGATGGGIRVTSALLKSLPPLSEKIVQAQVCQLYQAAGFTVRSTSQYRASHIAAGIPDLLLFHRGIKRQVWHETKPRKKNGELKPLSDKQKEFQADCEACDIDFVFGGLEEAQAYLVSVKLGEMRGGVFWLTPGGPTP